MRRESNRENISHKQLTEKQMEAFSLVVKKGLKHGGHSVIWCSFDQLRQWYHLLAVVEEKYKSDYVVNDYITKVTESPSFTKE